MNETLRGRPVETAQRSLDDKNYDLKLARLATPAVRGLLKQHGVSMEAVTGSGKEGRVLKEDVHIYVANRDNAAPSSTSSRLTRSTKASPSAQRESATPLTQMQAQMLKRMTQSLRIPHFLYADEVNMTSLSALRTRLKQSLKEPHTLSYLHFIIKAVSLALERFPLLNARLEFGDSDNDQRPQLIMRSQINIGVAMDTPQGLLVPNIKDVSALSINEIAAECSRLQILAKDGKLGPKDLTGGTFTVSNIGSIGGTIVSPVIVSTEVGILGIGRVRTVPAFGEDGEVVKKNVVDFSWSADHRVVDGAALARMAGCVKGFVEEPAGMMLVGLR